MYFRIVHCSYTCSYIVRTRTLFVHGHTCTSMGTLIRRWNTRLFVSPSTGKVKTKCQDSCCTCVTPPDPRLRTARAQRHSLHTCACKLQYSKIALLCSQLLSQSCHGQPTHNSSQLLAGMVSILWISKHGLTQYNN